MRVSDCWVSRCTYVARALLDVDRRLGLAHLVLDLAQLLVALCLLLADVRREAFAHRLGVRPAALCGGRRALLGLGLGDARRAHRAGAVRLELVAQAQVRKEIEHVGVHRKLPLTHHAVEEHHRLERHFAVGVVAQQLDHRIVALLGGFRPALFGQLRDDHRKQVLAVVKVRRARQQRAESTQGHRGERRRAPDLGLAQLEVLAVDAHDALLPLAPPRDFLAHLFLLFLLGQGTDAVAGQDIHKDGQQGEERELPDIHVHRDHRLALLARRRLGARAGKDEEAPQPVQTELGVADNLRGEVRNLLARHRERRRERAGVARLRVGDDVVRRTQPEPRRVHRGRLRRTRALDLLFALVRVAEHDAARLGLRAVLVELLDLAVLGADRQAAVRERLALALHHLFLALVALGGLLQVGLFEVARIVVVAIVHPLVLRIARAFHVGTHVAEAFGVRLGLQRLQRLALLLLFLRKARALFSLRACTRHIREARTREELQRLHVVLVVAVGHVLGVLCVFLELVRVLLDLGTRALGTRRLFARRGTLRRPRRRTAAAAAPRTRRSSPVRCTAGHGR